MMYKVFFYLAFSVIPLFSYGQTFHSGLKAGLGGAFFKNTDIKNEYSFSYLIGAYSNCTVVKDKGISIQAEVLFSRKGGASYMIFTDVSSYPLTNKKLSYDLFYLEIPLMVKLSSRGEASRVYFMTGLSPAFFLKGQSRYDIFNGANIKNANSFDLGWVNNIGIEFNISRTQLLFLEGRANNGLINVFPSVDIRNFSYTLMSGIRF